MKDPTRDELVEFFRDCYPRITCGEPWDSDGASYDIEEAVYYVASHYHDGQGSNLYSALSMSPFTPGPLSPDLPDDENRYTASQLYREASRWIEN